MREHGITGVTRRRRRSLTRPDRQARSVPDLIGRDFTATRRGPRLVGDITYLPTLRAGCIWPAGWTWPPARSSATPWPTTTAPSW